MRILILLLISNFCFGQEQDTLDVHYPLSVDSVAPYRVTLKFAPYSELIKKIDSLSERIKKLEEQSIPQSINVEEYVSFKPLYYSTLNSDDKGNFTSKQVNQSVESNRQFDGDGELTFQFREENGTIVALGSLGVRLLKINGVTTLQMAINGGYFPKTITGEFNSLSVFKLKREGNVMKVLYSKDNISFIEIGDFSKIGYNSYGNIFFSSFVPNIGDGVKSAKLKAILIINRT